MALPSSYTEETLATYMHAELLHSAQKGSIGHTLQWAAPSGDSGEYAAAVDNTLLIYGETTISSITGSANLRKLRAIAAQELWRLVAQRTSGRFTSISGVDGASFSNRDIHERALVLLKIAEKEVDALDADSVIDDTAVNQTAIPVARKRKTNPYARVA